MDKSIQQLKYSDLTEKIIMAGFKVHSVIGPGFPEIIYQRSLVMELKAQGINAKAKFPEKFIIISTKLVADDWIYL